MNSTLFKKAKRLNIKGYCSKTTLLRAHLVNLETLLVLKLMTIGRQKDATDALSLLLARRNEVDLVSLAKMAEDAGLSRHLLNRLRDYARKLREGELGRIWFSVTASRLPYIERQEIGRFFTRLADLLCQP